MLGYTTPAPGNAGIHHTCHGTAGIHHTCPWECWDTSHLPWDCWDTSHLPVGMLGYITPAMGLLRYTTPAPGNAGIHHTCHGTAGIHHTCPWECWDTSHLPVGMLGYITPARGRLGYITPAHGYAGIHHTCHGCAGIHHTCHGTAGIHHSCPWECWDTLHLPVRLLGYVTPAMGHPPYLMSERMSCQREQWGTCAMSCSRRILIRHVTGHTPADGDVSHPTASTCRLVLNDFSGWWRCQFVLFFV